MSEPTKILFYSHDTVGLGHLRRTLAICQGLGMRFRDLSMLVVTGSAMADGFRLPRGVDCVKLPCVTKLENECYIPRRLPLNFEEILELRREIIFHTARSYRPDLVFVDNVPLGMKQELVKTLDFLRRSADVSVFLGLRDILDDPSEIVPLWQRLDMFKAIERYYDRILIYGLPSVFDLVNEYGLPEAVRRKTSFVGYVERRADPELSAGIRRRFCQNGEKLILITVGGGADGAALISAYLEALPAIRAALRASSVVVLGPEMNARAAISFAQSRRQDLTFIDFCEDLSAYIAAADLVVSMAGYNTVSEILSHRTKAVVVPRVKPRTEQLIRASRLEQLGLVRMIHPDDLCPQRLAYEVLEQLCSAQGPVDGIPFTGIARLAEEIGAMLARRSRPAMAPALAGAQ